ncbi:uncharacterized protein BJ212DRAFT_1481495 [Suillus subaureus]|uniref:Uncharacterized protein n=1 Tax=Suillus subaureus TaxID=48587 RepID=A0A9P7JDB1_9AGAM|nr:uncharacterized protein BJ212DRAFT_1481495 [Suillus subaureus]KAG1815738.1 hypothetical protein BJ212DRAFT_1481495 [Suillus subaureus]
MTQRHPVQSQSAQPPPWEPVGAGHAPPPIVNIPLAQGKEIKNEDFIPDEDYVPSCPPSPNPNSQHQEIMQLVDCAVASKRFW